MKRDRSILFKERTKENCFFPKDVWILPTFFLHFIHSWVWNSHAAWIQARDSCHRVLGHLSHTASSHFLIWPGSLSLCFSHFHPCHTPSLFPFFFLTFLSFLCFFLSECLSAFLPSPSTLYLLMLWSISKRDLSLQFLVQ